MIDLLDCMIDLLDCMIDLLDCMIDLLDCMIDLLDCMIDFTNEILNWKSDQKDDTSWLTTSRVLVLLLYSTLKRRATQYTFSL